MEANDIVAMRVAATRRLFAVLLHLLSTSGLGIDLWRLEIRVDSESGLKLES